MNKSFWSWSSKRVLALSAHTDDAEFGCGGTLHVAQIYRAKVKAIAFCNAWQNLPQGFGFDSRTLVDECYAAFSELGISDVAVIDAFTVRRFTEKRQEILDMMVELKNKFAPDVVFVPCARDIHQDHRVIHDEAMRAFRHSSVFGYEVPGNTTEFAPTMFVRLSDDVLDTKVSALEKYESQSKRRPDIIINDLVRAQAITHGSFVRTRFAEAFEVYRLII